MTNMGGTKVHTSLRKVFTRNPYSLDQERTKTENICLIRDLLRQVPHQTRDPSLLFSQSIPKIIST